MSTDFAKLFSKIYLGTISNKINWYELDKFTRMEIFKKQPLLFTSGVCSKSYYFEFEHGLFYLFHNQSDYILCSQQNRNSLISLAAEPQNQDDLKTLYDYILKSKETNEDFVNRFMQSDL